MDDTFDIFITKFKVNNIEKYKEIILTEKIDNLGLDLGWEVLDRKYLDGSVVELKVKILNEKYDIFKPLNIFAKYGIKLDFIDRIIISRDRNKIEKALSKIEQFNKDKLN